MKRPHLQNRFSLSTVLLSLIVILGACAMPTTTPSGEVAPAATVATTTTVDTLFPLTITDAVGQEFTFDAPPKIGCWWAGCIEMLADLGIVPHAASYTEENANSVFFYPVGVPAHNIADTQNPEFWAAAEVYVILMRVPNDPAHDPLKAAAPIFYLHHPSYGESAQTGYQAFVENLHILGQLTGQPAAADAAIARFDNVLTNLRALSTPETQALTVAVLFNGEGYRFIAPGNPFCVVLAEVGLGNCVGEGAASTETNAEEFLSLDPDWIVYQIGDGLAADRTDPIWAQLTAVKEGHIYDAQGRRYYCCSLRGLTHALQEYAHYVLSAANIPAPGLWLDFDPLQSSLTQPSNGTNAVTTATSTSGTRQVTHELGTTAVPVNPQRIVALHDLSIANNMVQLGVIPIGAANAEDARSIGDFVLPDSVAPTGSIPEPNLEQIAALKPDLIICLDTHTELYEQLSAIAPTVAVRDYSAADALAAQRTVADLIGQTDLFNEQVAAYDARVAALREQLAPLQATLEVSAFGIYGENLYITHQIGWTHAKVFADLGLVTPPAITALIGDAEDQSASVSYEELPKLDSDVIFLIDPAYEDGLAKLEATGLLDLTFASGADQIFMVAADHWYRGGIAGLNLVLDDVEAHLLGKELDTSGDFR